MKGSGMGEGGWRGVEKGMEWILGKGEAGEGRVKGRREGKGKGREGE